MEQHHLQEAFLMSYASGLGVHLLVSQSSMQLLV